MAGVAITLSVDDGGLRAAVDGASAFGSDMSGLMRAAGEAMVSATVERFETGLGPGGVAWIPSRRAVREGGLTLVDKGRLKGSITAVSDDVSAEWGTNVIYAAAHQFGASIEQPRRRRVIETLYGDFDAGLVINLPARPFLGIDAGDIATLEDLSQLHLEMAAGGESASP
jgi:phage gpG-like protein